LTATVLAFVSLSVALVRRGVMGQEARVPAGPGSYKVTMVIRGKSTGDARLTTACPPDFNRQHVFGEEYTSSDLLPKMVETRQGSRRYLQWSQRIGASKGGFQARYEFYCHVDSARPNSAMTRLQKVLHSPPKPGENLASEAYVDPSDPSISQLAQDLTSGLRSPLEQARALYQHVATQIQKDPGVGVSGISAVECLHNGRGDTLAKSRLLVALCRNRNVPARLVTGLTLAKKNEQTAHTWVEAWVGDHWMPMCASKQYCGRVPATYLVFGFGDMQLVRGHNVRDLNYACLVEPQARPEDLTRPLSVSGLHGFFAAISLHNLPPAEGHLVVFLLLLPLAALIVCVYRNLIGIHSFGTFAPALIGLAFRELESLPGIMVFVSVVLIGWGMRRVLDRFHLLQVPRTAFMLSLVVVLLITAIVAANFQELAVMRYISLFPLVILTGMIERFWTLEAEDSTAASFKALFGTLLIAGTISLVLSLRAIVTHMVNYPETLGLVMAGQLLIGRYTGYRLVELFRFRDFLNPPSMDGLGEQPTYSV
jgi:hypothetical protein